MRLNLFVKNIISQEIVVTFFSILMSNRRYCNRSICLKPSSFVSMNHIRLNPDVLNVARSHDLLVGRKAYY